ncbi:DsrE family protein [Gimibacter soli]|uniref:DsrE family protein n=1 Tax=Gimibacter soli TaxID=3024400 RepID=A0AAF0BM74_9PROT|nr:DsrE family protein [Gimibacter soli]WCL54165.1 DsrE family protein [Gimibacter soli]
MKHALYALTALLAIAGPASAIEGFKAGPVIPDFGPIADNLKPDVATPKDQDYRVSFDIADGATPGEKSRQIETLARFINMMVDAGVPKERLHVAAVFHGGATVDVAKDDYYTANKQAANGNAALIAALVEAGAEIYVCGQSATRYGVTNTDLLPGVKMALSAITAHAMLANQGFRTNPF